jgi:hypothetical protein
MIENIQIRMLQQVFFLVWIFSQMWKIYMKKEYFITFFIEKKIIKFQKIKNHAVTFPYWFWSSVKFLMFR